MSSPFPKVCLVRQRFPEARPVDIRAGLKSEFEKIRANVKVGSAVALAVGSRGITNIDLIVRALVEMLQSAGARPFIIPAMGSHGGATARGQAEVLATYDITEATMGVPVRSSLEVREIGRTESGLPVLCSVDA